MNQPKAEILAVTPWKDVKNLSEVVLCPFGNVTINYPCDVLYLACILPSNGQGELKCVLLFHISYRNYFKVKQILL